MWPLEISKIYVFSASLSISVSNRTRKHSSTRMPTTRLLTACALYWTSLNMSFGAGVLCRDWGSGQVPVHWGLPVDRMTDRHCWKHYFPAISLAVDNNMMCNEKYIKTYICLCVLKYLNICIKLNFERLISNFVQRNDPASNWKKKVKIKLTWCT